MKYCLYLALLFIPAILFAGPRKPEIYGQDYLQGQEDQPFTIQLNHLRVYDPDDYFYPWGFSLTVYPGDNYAVNGTTITPAANFSGNLVVRVSVNDGQSESNKFDLQILIVPVNDPPSIVAHASLSIIEGTPITLQLSHFTVTDPDNTYPNGFSLVVYGAANYTHSGTTVTPNVGSVGTVNVLVTVSDGGATSAQYSLPLTVLPANKTPIIRGQVPLATAKNKSLTLALNNLQVEDPDSNFPGDFTLLVYAGQNYTFSGSVITPVSNFTGNLQVKVAVNDGNSTSEIYNLLIQVKDELTITGQEAMEIKEDESINVALGYLKVYDPNGQFPSGYSVNILAGENYTFSGTKVTPAANYAGPLPVSVNVSNGTYTSPAYNFQINVMPVNDPPELVDFPQEPLRYGIGNGPLSIIQNSSVRDVDDETIVLAEVGLRAETFQSGNEVLSFASTDKIKGVFDPVQGVLTLIGEGSLQDYQQVLNSITYEYTNVEDPLPQNKVVYFKLNDGKDVSVAYEREILVSENLELDIPTVFTPNNDAANDTWKIKPFRPSERYSNMIIRVFNKRGLLVYEGHGYQSEWDGIFQGERLPADTYFFTIDFNLSYTTKAITGAVSILY